MLCYQFPENINNWNCANLSLQLSMPNDRTIGRGCSNSKLAWKNLFNWWAWLLIRIFLHTLLAFTSHLPPFPKSWLQPCTHTHGHFKSNCSAKVFSLYKYRVLQWTFLSQQKSYLLARQCVCSHSTVCSKQFAECFHLVLSKGQVLVFSALSECTWVNVCTMILYRNVKL